MRPANTLGNVRQPRIGVGFRRLPLYMRGMHPLQKRTGLGQYGDGGGDGSGDFGSGGAPTDFFVAPSDTPFVGPVDTTVSAPPGFVGPLPLESQQVDPSTLTPNEISAVSPDGTVIQFTDGSVLDMSTGNMSNPAGDIIGNANHGDVVGTLGDGTIVFSDGTTFKPSTGQFGGAIPAAALPGALTASKPPGAPSSGGPSAGGGAAPKTSAPSSTPPACPSGTIMNPATGQCGVPIPAATARAALLPAPAGFLQQAPLGVKNEYLLLGLLGLMVIPPLIKGKR